MAEDKSSARPDVSKPGKHAPSATSRPIIVSHGPMLKDPMVQNKKIEVNAEPSPEPAKTSRTKTIKPDSETTLSATDADQATGEPLKKETTKAPIPEVSPKPLPSGESPEAEVDVAEDDSLTESSPEAEVDAVAAQSATDKQKAEAATKAEQEKLAELNHLIAERTYAVPIGVFHKTAGGWKKILLIIVTLVVLGAAAYASVSLT